MLLVQYIASVYHLEWRITINYWALRISNKAKKLYSYFTCEGCLRSGLSSSHIYLLSLPLNLLLAPSTFFVVDLFLGFHLASIHPYIHIQGEVPHRDWASSMNLRQLARSDATAIQFLFPCVRHNSIRPSHIWSADSQQLLRDSESSVFATCPFHLSFGFVGPSVLISSV